MVEKREDNMMRGSTKIPDSIFWTNKINALKQLWIAQVAHHKLLRGLSKFELAGLNVQWSWVTDSEKAINDARECILVLEPSWRDELAAIYPEPEKGDE